MEANAMGRGTIIEMPQDVRPNMNPIGLSPVERDGEDTDIVANDLAMQTSTGPDGVDAVERVGTGEGGNDVDIVVEGFGTAWDQECGSIDHDLNAMSVHGPSLYAHSAPGKVMTEEETLEYAIQLSLETPAAAPQRPPRA